MEESHEPTKYEEWKDSSMERHDLYNFETKIEYTLERTEKKKTSYLLDTYFFFPDALQINKDSYSKEQFFSDLNNRIRFKTPQMSIDGIIDEKNKLSPLNTIIENLKRIEYGKTSKKTQTTTHRELRLLACIIRVTLRDQFKYFMNEFPRLKAQYNIEELLESYLTSLEKLQNKIESIGELFLKIQIPAKLREAYTLADDYISLQIEIWITEILKAFENRLNESVKNHLIRVIEREQAHRANLQSRLILDETKDNEGYSYWEGILKKYVQSVLYLEKRKKDPKSSSLEVFYFIAAGVAMFLSLFLGFLIISNFEMYSIPFILGAVVIYMLKDRIKETIRGVSERAVGLVFPDQRIDIVDGFNEELIGVSKEKINFIDWNIIPPEILKIRRASERSQIEEKGKPEVVILYKKKISLFNSKIEEYHKRRRDLSDILRFNIRHFLRYADDPVQYKLNWNSLKKSINKISISKVYHINVIFKLTSFKEKQIGRVFFKKIRIILDQKGIKNVLEPKILL